MKKIFLLIFLIFYLTGFGRSNQYLQGSNPIFGDKPVSGSTKLFLSQVNKESLQKNSTADRTFSKLRLSRELRDSFSPIDAFGKLKLGDRKARLDNFIIQLSKANDYRGLITLVFDKKDSRKYMLSILKAMQKHLIFRKSNLSQICFAISTGDSEETVLWLIHKESTFPYYVAEKNYQIIEGQKILLKLNNLFVKK